MAVETSAPRPLAGGAAQLVCILAFVLLYMPLVTVAFYSFLVPDPVDPSLRSFGWDWYARVFSNRQLLSSLWVSISVATVSSLIATCLGTLTALALERGIFPGRRFLDALVLIPMAMPELVLGLSLLIWFVMLHLTLGWISVVLAHTTFCVSYVVITVRARLKDFDSTLEEAAYDLGASRWQSFWRVKFPLVRPGVYAGMLMAFTLSFDDFIITFFTAGVGSDTLPLKLYSMTRLSINPEVYALSTLLLIATFLLIFVLSWLGFGWLERSK